MTATAATTRSALLELCATSKQIFPDQRLFMFSGSLD